MDTTVKRATSAVQLVAAAASFAFFAAGQDGLDVIALSVAFLAWGLRIGISSDAKGGE